MTTEQKAKTYKKANDMDYKQKYEEALSRASKLRVQNPFDTVSQMMEHIFPELAESKDERIRNWLIGYFHQYKEDGMEKFANGLKVESIIAWLEKQGEKIQYWKPSEEQLEALDYAYNSCPDTERGNYYEGVLGTLIDNLYKLQENQGEQKSIDKVESKFHEGDWVVQENIGVYKVIEVCESWYEVVDNKGNHYSIGFDKEYMCHLWTIQDAKDGDILMANAPFIFNGNLEGGIGCPGAHCAINTLGEFQIPTSPKHWTGHTTTPATKEQRDLLFAKMEEAGYIWDNDEKELKKIKQKPTDKIEPKFHEGDWIVWELGELSNTLLITKIDKSKNRYLFNDNTDVSFSDERYLHLWTIKDAKDGDVLACENGCVFIFKALNDHTNTFSSHCFMASNKWFCNTGSECHTLDGASVKFYNGEIHPIHPATKEQRSLLFQKMKDAGYEWDVDKKELKLLISNGGDFEYNNNKQNPTWSEEDEHRFKDTIYFLDTAKKHYASTVELDACIEWLKSLKQRLGK